MRDSEYTSNTNEHGTCPKKKKKKEDNNLVASVIFDKNIPAQGDITINGRLACFHGTLQTTNKT
jgi:hypothetical protein